MSPIQTPIGALLVRALTAPGAATDLVAFIGVCLRPTADTRIKAARRRAGVDARGAGGRSPHQPVRLGLSSNFPIRSIGSGKTMVDDLSPATVVRVSM